MREEVYVPVAEPSLVGAARRAVCGLADHLGWEDEALGRIGVVVTELANNVLAHAGGGDVFARSVRRDGPFGIELTVVDRGDGIADVQDALRDGFSTGGSPGTGLGAVSRMADDFQIHSEPGTGTVCVAYVRRERSDRPAAATDVGALVRPHPREEVSGDAWGLRRDDGRVALALVDGLGHGPEAEKASRTAVESFTTGEWEGTRGAVEAMHEALRPTRGGVGAVLEVDPRAGRARFTGVGNVTGAVLDGASRRSLVSTNGTLGRQLRTLREDEVPWGEGRVAVLHTDGLGARWTGEEVADLVGRAPGLLCGALYLRRYRGTDDAGVVAVRWTDPDGPIGGER